MTAAPQPTPIAGPGTPAVHAAGVTLAHGGRPVLVDVSFDLPRACLVAVIGPNGSGKSTLLRAVAGLLAPAAGTLVVAAGRRPGGVAFVLQNMTVDRSLPLTVREAVTIARYGRRGLWRRLTTADRGAIRRAMERMDIADLAHRQLSELSGGQRQRAFVAQGLAQEADLLLLDEPFTGVDLVSKQLVLDAVAEEVAAGRTVVMSTHELADARRADAVVLLAGRLVGCGRPEDVLTDDVLASAYGTSVVHLEGGRLYVDDPHHAATAARVRGRTPEHRDHPDHGEC